MKRILSAILICCLFCFLLAGCAQELPSLPPLPEKDAPAETAPPEETVPPEPTPTPVPVPAALELSFALPDGGEDAGETAYYFSPAEEFDCGFCYPSYCSLWVEKGAIRLDPGWFFARMFLSGTARDAEGAPEALIDMLEPGKWNSVPGESTVGSGYSALRMNHLKYDTWRRWIAWETPERYFLLYGVCFDGRENDVGAIFQTIANSFLTGDELLLSAPAEGELLRESDALRLAYDGAQLRTAQGRQIAELRLSVENNSGRETILSASALTGDGLALPFEESCTLSGGESLVWTLALPLSGEEGGAPCSALALQITARGGEELFSLPVSITLSK